MCSPGGEGMICEGGNDVGAEPREGGGIEKKLGVEHWLQRGGENHYYRLDRESPDNLATCFGKVLELARDRFEK